MILTTQKICKDRKHNFVESLQSRGEFSVVLWVCTRCAGWIVINKELVDRSLDIQKPSGGRP
jgi:hypothetical protein